MPGLYRKRRRGPDYQQLELERRRDVARLCGATLPESSNLKPTPWRVDDAKIQDAKPAAAVETTIAEAKPASKPSFFEDDSDESDIDLFALLNWKRPKDDSPPQAASAPVTRRKAPENAEIKGRNEAPRVESQVVEPVVLIDRGAVQEPLVAGTMRKRPFVREAQPNETDAVLTTHNAASPERTILETSHDATATTDPLRSPASADAKPAAQPRNCTPSLPPHAGTDEPTLGISEQPTFLEDAPPAADAAPEPVARAAALPVTRADPPGDWENLPVESEVVFYHDDYDYDLQEDLRTGGVKLREIVLLGLLGSGQVEVSHGPWGAAASAHAEAAPAAAPPPAAAAPTSLGYGDHDDDEEQYVRALATAAGGHGEDDDEEHGRRGIFWSQGLWCYHPTQETLDGWTARVLPSRVGGQGWIFVDNHRPDSPGFGKATGTANYTYCRRQLREIENHLHLRSRVPAKLKQQVVTNILAECVRSGDTCGKWLLFFPKEMVDHYWEAIAHATANGHLGYSAKVSPAKHLPPGKYALCCVYVKDFSDRANVKRVLLALKGLGMKLRCGFKPDIFTELNIYNNNEWKLKTTIYSVKEVLAANFVANA